MGIERVIISGGGTGGHIFPALSIAGEIKRRFPDANILFVGAAGRMEMEKVPEAGYKIIGLPVTGFPRKPGLSMITFFVRLIKSAKQAKKVIREFRPQVAIGVGGFASGPVLRAAVRANIPALIQEQNSYAGITNKLLGKKVNKICVAYDHMDRYFPSDKIVFTGNPVRKNLLDIPPSKEEALKYFEIQGACPVILILGGSLGARSVNEAVISNLNLVENSAVEFIWQTGGYYYDRIMDGLKANKPGNLHVYKFITRMDLAYAASDVVISRAGAGTISELCVLGKAVILVPSPNVAEDHQTKNALNLAEKEAAVLIRDNETKELLLEEAVKLVKNKEGCLRLSERIRELSRPNATESIVDEVVKLVKK